MNRNLFIVLVLCSVITFSCKDETDLYIDASLEPFFLAFQSEGAKRGIIVDFESLGIEGFLTDITLQNVVGQCSHTEESPNAISVDPLFWRSATDSRKEFVIFHELGHCYLKRAHLDSSDEYGNCISMMHSSANTCHSDYESNREQYIDELFSK